MKKASGGDGEIRRRRKGQSREWKGKEGGGENSGRLRGRPVACRGAMREGRERFRQGKRRKFDGERESRKIKFNFRANIL